MLLQMMGDSIQTWKKKYGSEKEMMVERVLQGKPALPLWNTFGGAEPNGTQRFQVLVQNYLQDLPLEYQLNKLNEIQKSCPFLIADPNASKIDDIVKFPGYGYADLYRFMGLQFSNNPYGKMAHIAKVGTNKPIYTPQVPPGNLVADVDGSRYYDGNPLYVPAYPIPDYEGNKILLSIYENNPGTLVKKLENMYNMFTENSMKLMQGGGWGFNPKDEHSKYIINSNFKDMLTLVHHIIKKDMDPRYFTNLMYSPLNPLPMKTYFRNNLDSLMYQMMIGHQIYTPKKKSSTDMEITSRALQDVKKHMDADHKADHPAPRRKSGSKKHYKSRR